MSETGEPAAARPAKSASAYRTIGEVAEDLDLPAHVLRFWESKFPQLQPLKRGGGRRYYRPEDIALLRRIRQCLYQDGYTIRGVQKLLGSPTEDGADSAMPTLFPLEAATEPPPGPEEPVDPPATRPRQPRRPRRPAKPDDTGADNRVALEEIRRELAEARALLDGLLRPKVP